MGRAVSDRRPSLAHLTLQWQQDPRRASPEFTRQVRAFVRRRYHAILRERHARRTNPDDVFDILADGTEAALKALAKWRSGVGHVAIRDFIAPDVNRAIKAALAYTKRPPRLSPPDNPGSPEDSFIRALDLQRAVRRIDPDTKKILRWCLLSPNPATTHYAAACLDLSESTVKRRLRDGTRVLTELLSDGHSEHTQHT